MGVTTERRDPKMSFERLSFLTGTLQGLLEKRAEVGRGIRAGAIFMLPFYVYLPTY